MVFLSCTGPQIGAACRTKGDCDVVCSCDSGIILGPNHDHQGPADGTQGVVGKCGGHLQVGVWMCEIDEQGAVTHVIVD